MVRFLSDLPGKGHQVYEAGVTLEAGTVARVATGNGESFEMPTALGIAGILQTTALATLVGDTCDVYVQTYVGDVWTDVIRFTRLLGNGTDAQVHIGKLCPGFAETMYDNSAALAESAIRDIAGLLWRARWVIAGTGSFTFSVKVQPVG
jgi:hypothetical protein